MLSVLFCSEYFTCQAQSQMIQKDSCLYRLISIPCDLNLSKIGGVQKWPSETHLCKLCPDYGVLTELTFL